MLLMLLSRTLFTYFFVLVALRVMGKREIGKLSIFDLVVSIIIAEISAVSLQDTRIPIWHGAFVIILLVLLQVGVAFISLKSRRMHDLIEGKPTFLITNGKINDSEMKRTRYNMNDLLMQLREKNITSVADVEFAVLETSGKLSVFSKSEKMPVTPQDLNIVTQPLAMTTSIIVDGQVDYDKLSAINKSPKWLLEQIAMYGYQSPKDVFYAGWDGQTLHMDRIDNQNQTNTKNPQL